MISPSGAVTLVDFGVARANLPLHCPDRGVAGKYNYMAPEQIRNEPLDRRTDLFSLGIILYELTVGERLFRGPAESVMHKVLEEPIPAPRLRDRGYPAELEAIVLRALQRDPDERYQSAAALLSDLQAYLARRVGTPAEAALSRWVEVSGPLRTSSAKPNIAFRGPLRSWLMEARKSARMRSAIRRTVSRSASSMRHANSSPPKRATRSCPRVALASACATARSAASPAR